MISEGGKVFDEFVVSEECGLFKAIHALLDFDIYITFVADEVLSAERKRAPRFASLMVLLSGSFVSRRLAAGEDGSPSKGSLSPPATQWMRHGSALSGRKPQTNAARPSSLLRAFMNIFFWVLGGESREFLFSRLRCRHG